jgi:hypothetical protein
MAVWIERRVLVIWQFAVYIQFDYCLVTFGLLQRGRKVIYTEATERGRMW